jgi:hypothetical protein
MKAKVIRSFILQAKLAGIVVRAYNSPGDLTVVATLFCIISRSVGFEPILVVASVS